MTRLAIETSTEAFSVALEHNGAVSEAFAIAPREHGDRLLPAVEQLLADQQTERHQIEQIVYGQGPGGFTGVRIAVAAAQGLAFGLGVQLQGVSSLHNLAFQTMQQTDAAKVLVATDARMDEVYFAEFDRQGDYPILVGSERVSSPSELSLPDKGIDWAAVGSGWQVYSDLIAIQSEPVYQAFDLLPKASVALSLSAHQAWATRLVEPELAVPVYLRNNVAKKSTKPLLG